MENLQDLLDQLEIKTETSEEITESAFSRLPGCSDVKFVIETAKNIITNLPTVSNEPFVRPGTPYPK